MQVTFHGVRGSTPCHGSEIARYGGNTSCVSIEVPGGDPLFLDMGTGARYFGRTMPLDGTFRGTCLVSHLHWDHIQGLPFFTPLMHPHSTLDLYAPSQEDGRTVAYVFEATVRPPLFPIGIEEFPGTVRFHDLDDDDFKIGEIAVKSRLVPHIGPTLGYRLEWGGRSIAYLSDHQQPYDGSFSVSDGARELIDGVDVLIHDAQYTPHEFKLKATWGHCTVEYAVWLAQECRVGTLAMFHHDPTRSDEALDELHRCAALAGKRHGVEVIAAREGLRLSVGG